MQGANYCDDGFIAAIYNSAIVWIKHLLYTNADSNVSAKILQLEYKSDITIKNYYSGISIRWINVIVSYHLVVVGGLVPSFLTPDESLLAGKGFHYGTIDLDLDLYLVILDTKRYEDLSLRLYRADISS
jgi:hypothetical protein